MFRALLSFLVIGVAMIGSPISVKAPSNFLFDDFSGSNLSPQWTYIHAGSLNAGFTVSNDILRMTSGGSGAASPDDLHIATSFIPSSDSFEVTARVRTHSFGRFHIALASQPGIFDVLPTIAFEFDLTGNQPGDCGNNGAAIYRTGGNYAVFHCSPSIETWYRLQVLGNRNPWTATWSLLSDFGSLIATTSTTNPAYSYEGIQYLALGVWCGWEGCQSDYDIDWISTSTSLSQCASGLCANWQFEEGFGTTTADSRPNAHTGTLNNGPAWTPGMTGNALSFDGIDDFVASPDADDLTFPGGNFTVEAWFKLNTVHQAGSLQKWILLKNGEYGMVLEHDGFLKFYVASESSLGGGYQTAYKASTRNFWQANRWYHAAVVYENGITWRIYIDGMPDASGNQSYIPNVTDRQVTIGAAVDPVIGASLGFLDGVVDSVGLYSLARSEFEIPLRSFGMLSPVENHQYIHSNIPLILNITEPTSYLSYSLDNGLNITMSSLRLNFTIMDIGVHNITAYAIDINGFAGKSGPRVFSTCVGDLNQGGEITILDIAMVAVSFDSVNGNPGYQFLSDIDEDGDVDILDVAVVALNFGKVCP